MMILKLFSFFYNYFLFEMSPIRRNYLNFRGLYLIWTIERPLGQSTANYFKIVNTNWHVLDFDSDWFCFSDLDRWYRLTSLVLQVQIKCVQGVFSSNVPYFMFQTLFHFDLCIFYLRKEIFFLNFCWLMNARKGSSLLSSEWVDW